MGTLPLFEAQSILAFVISPVVMPLREALEELMLLYFPSTESQKQEELITIGGNIGQGDEFRFSVRELSALLETESDTDYHHGSI